MDDEGTGRHPLVEPSERHCFLLGQELRRDLPLADRGPHDLDDDGTCTLGCFAAREIRLTHTAFTDVPLEQVAHARLHLRVDVATAE